MVLPLSQKLVGHFSIIPFFLKSCLSVKPMLLQTSEQGRISRACSAEHMVVDPDLTGLPCQHVQSRDVKVRSEIDRAK